MGKSSLLKKPREEFETVADIRRFLHSKGVSSYDFLVNRSAQLSNPHFDWEVIVTNPDAFKQIKELVESKNINCRQHSRKNRTSPN